MPSLRRSAPLLTPCLILALSACTTTTPRSTADGVAREPARRPGSFAVVDGEPVPIPDVPMGDRRTVRRVIHLAKTDSRVMDHLSVLCETFGTRLTGSSACEAANRWAVDQFQDWGLASARVEQWGTLDARFDRLASSGAIVSRPHRRGDADQGEPGWTVDREIEFSTLSWTRGTEGPTTGPVVRMPDSLSDAEGMADDLQGAWVLLPAHYADRRGVRGVGYSMRERNTVRHEIRTGAYDPAAEPEAETWSGSLDFEGTPMDVLLYPERDSEGVIVAGRIEMPEFHEGDVTGVIHTDDSLRMVWPNPLEQTEIELTIVGETMTGKAGTGEHALTLDLAEGPDDRALTRDDDLILAAVLDAEPAGFISASRDERVWTTRPTNWRETDPADLPRDIEVSVRRSDYDHINSRLADGREVHARFNLDHRVDPGPIPVYNTIAEIRGATRPDEVVIVSAHLDSWDGPGSQGTVDNGTGSAVVIEAARLLTAAGARPDRTIRFILWTGEEQGLLGSRAYVEALGEDERARISAVFVDDGGTNYQGGIPAADVMVNQLAAATAPINNQFYSETDGEFLNVNIRPTGEKLKTHGGSDHAPFNKVGIPGFFWDEVGRANYRYAWHTQNDKIDQAIPEYLVQSSACTAVTAYNLASTPDLLAREGEPREPIIADARHGTPKMAEQAATGR